MTARFPRYLVVMKSRQCDGVTIIERASFAYSKPRLVFVNGGWIEYENETGNGTSANLRFVESIHKLTSRDKS